MSEEEVKVIIVRCSIKPGICRILPKRRFLHHNLDIEIRFLAMQTLLRYLQ